MSTTFITASGTEIGKTFVTAALIYEFKRRGETVRALKPIVSGFDDNDAQESDPGILLTALGETLSPAAIARIAPWRFTAPLSPDMAARREGRAIDFDALVAFSRTAMKGQQNRLLIEGVGGVMVPLTTDQTVLDWIAALDDVSAVLVGGSYLGAISHTLTALNALNQSGVSVRAIVVNETPGSAVDLDETTATIARFAPGTTVIAWPRLAGPNIAHPALQRLADLL